MKLSDVQKRITKALTIYPIAYTVSLVFFRLIKGNVDWTEILLSSIASILVSIFLIFLFIFGSKTPEK